jgi:hypothetical protein
LELDNPTRWPFARYDVGMAHPALIPAVAIAAAAGGAVLAFAHREAVEAKARDLLALIRTHSLPLPQVQKAAAGFGRESIRAYDRGDDERGLEWERATGEALREAARIEAFSRRPAWFGAAAHAAPAAPSHAAPASPVRVVATRPAPPPPPQGRSFLSPPPFIAPPSAFAVPYAGGGGGYYGAFRAAETPWGEQSWVDRRDLRVAEQQAYWDDVDDGGGW